MMLRLPCTEVTEQETFLTSRLNTTVSLPLCRALPRSVCFSEVTGQVFCSCEENDIEKKAFKYQMEPSVCTDSLISLCQMLQCKALVPLHFDVFCFFLKPSSLAVVSLRWYRVSGSCSRKCGYVKIVDFLLFTNTLT